MNTISYIPNTQNPTALRNQGEYTDGADAAGGNTRSRAQTQRGPGKQATCIPMAVKTDSGATYCVLTYSICLFPFFWWTWNVVEKV